MKRRTNRILLIILGSVSALMTFLMLIGPNLFPLISGYLTDKADPQTPTSAKPAMTIKPLPVRPVVSAFVTTPAQCPPPARAAAPDKPIRVCDIPRTAVYELGPQALTLQLINADSIHDPLTGVEVVQISMTSESAEDFSKYTTGQVGKQVAFVRDGAVVWGPKIGAPIEGQVLQFSGDLTPEQAREIAKSLKDGT